MIDCDTISGFCVLKTVDKQSSFCVSCYLSRASKRICIFTMFYQRQLFSQRRLLFTFEKMCFFSGLQSRFNLVCDSTDLKWLNGIQYIDIFRFIMYKQDIKKLISVELNGREFNDFTCDAIRFTVWKFIEMCGTNWIWQIRFGNYMRA